MADGTPPERKKRSATSKKKRRRRPPSEGKAGVKPTSATSDDAGEKRSRPLSDAPRRRKVRPMTAERKRSLGGRALIVTACFVIIVAGLQSAREIVVPFLFSIFIAVLAAPPIAAMRKRGIPMAIAMLAVLGVLFLGGVFVASVVTRSYASFEDNKPEYKLRIDEATASLREFGDRYRLEVPPAEISDEAGGDDPPSVPPEDGRADSDPVVDSTASEDVASSEGLESQESVIGWRDQFMGWIVAQADIDQLIERIDIEQVVVTVTAVVFSEAMGLVTNSVLILLTVIFLLLESSTVPRKVLAISGKSGREMLERVTSIADDVNQYVLLKTLLSMLTGLLVVIFLTWLDVDYAMLWGLLAFLLNFVPNLGSILAALPAVLLAALQHGFSTAGLVMAGFVAINMLVGNVIEPRVLGRGLGLSTLVVFLSLVFWGWVLGAAGMVLSVPLTMACKVALDSSGDMRWAAILLSGDPRTQEPRPAASPSTSAPPSPE